MLFWILHLKHFCLYKITLCDISQHPLSVQNHTVRFSKLAQGIILVHNVMYYFCKYFTAAQPSPQPSKSTWTFIYLFNYYALVRVFKVFSDKLNSQRFLTVQEKRGRKFIWGYHHWFLLLGTQHVQIFSVWFILASVSFSLLPFSFSIVPHNISLFLIIY